MSTQRANQLSTNKRLMIAFATILSLIGLSVSRASAYTEYKYFDAWANESQVYTNGVNRFMQGGRMQHFDSTWPIVTVMSWYPPSGQQISSAAQATEVTLSHGDYYSKSYCWLYNSVDGGGVPSRCWYRSY